jgi:hypothetical protein
MHAGAAQAAAADENAAPPAAAEPPLARAATPALVQYIFRAFALRRKRLVNEI